MRILVVPATTLIAYEILQSLGTAKDISLLGATSDINPNNSFPFVEMYFLPNINTNSLIQLQNLVDNVKPDFVLPAHDEWLELLGDLDYIKSSGIMKSSTFSIKVTTRKSLTYRYLKNVVNIPKVFYSESEIDSYPVFVKPDRGQGSRNTHCAFTPNQLREILSNNPNTDFVICEFLPGSEFTVDCFSNLQSELIFAQQRVRENYTSGKALRTYNIEMTSEIKSWSRGISATLQLKGAWFFQYKLDKMGEPRLLEVGARIAGASGITRLQGVNLSLMNLHLFTEPTVKIQTYLQTNKTLVDVNSGFEIGFQFEEIFVDLDDTLSIGTRKNVPLLSYLASQRKRGIDITVITRNSNPVPKLFSLCDYSSFYNKLVIVQENKPKSFFIKSTSNFLFIDDSHQERIEIKRVFGDSVLVLDPTFCWQGYF
jgi:carbamoyl-phosphate synthase large subunit